MHDNEGYEIALFLEETRENVFKFEFGKITDENQKTINNKGEIDEAIKLPDGKKLCYITHGTFFCKKNNNIEQCLLLIEKRHAALSIRELMYYLNKLNDKLEVYTECKITDLSINDERDFNDFITHVKKAKIVCFKHPKYLINSSIEGNMGERRAEQEVWNLIKSGSITVKIEPEWKQKIGIWLYRIISKISNKNDKEQLLEHLKKTKPIILGCLDDSSEFRWYDIFGEKYANTIIVEQNNNKVLISKDFFKKLEQKFNDTEINRLFELIAQIYDTIKVIKTPEKSE